MPADAVRDAFYQALEAADLGDLRARRTRLSLTTCATRSGPRAQPRGIDLRRIQAWMGLADIQTTMRYLQYVPQHDDAARLTAAFTTDDVPQTVPRIGVIPA